MNLRKFMKRKTKELLNSKKGQMGLPVLYQGVLTLGLVAIISGIVLVVLGKFQTTGSTTASANTSLQAAETAIGEVATDWMSLLVTVMVTSVILFMIASGFAYFGFGLGGRR